MPERGWWQVTYRSTAEMTVWVQAESAKEAKAKAENVEYDEATPVEFVRGRPFTMKAKPAPDFEPSEYTP